tara:strand:- start:186 stop:473 length:288 start_codon:yes stop_codon:yes gene_type:complete
MNNKEYKFLTSSEEDELADLAESFVEDDFQFALSEATAANEGYEERSQDIKALLLQIHKEGGRSESYAALGEYLYLLAWDNASETALRGFEYSEY